ncbi:MAG: M6 family metalloprotease domain-containing protein [Bacteroidales bacterium]|nr:M6 family metalloprotease domain-containing protein [Bacteroidales bacterium]
MRTRNILTAAVAALICTAAFAIPASPVPFAAVQPDGTTIMLQQHGDEFFHWTTLAGSSQVMKKDLDGWWRPTTIDFEAKAKAAATRRNAANANRQYRTHTDNLMTHGERHIPVFLVQFTDLSFKISNPAEKFDALLNQQGYSANGGTGSVRDFYMDNSDGQFQPVFDVYGPVDLPNNMAYYGGNDSSGNDSRPEEALIHAAKALDSVVDFSQYDYDNDGYVDMALFYYAGYNEAEYGPANSIWPHQWNAQYVNLGRTSYFDGKRLAAYFCTSELKSNTGTSMCGIGTTCHEFGHSLGLPDFYDTDYTENGQAGGLYYFSTMDSGAYLNNGCTPPFFNAEERILLGWMTEDDVPILPRGEVSFPSVRYSITYKSLTDVEGEYFLYECRDATGWDKYLPAGLVIYHVDKSKVRKVGGITPYQQWANWESYNSINAYGSHPCFYIIPAANQSSLNYSSNNLKDYVFPGSKNKTTYSPVDWNKADTGVEISGISYSSSDKKVYLTTKYKNEPVGSLQEMGFNAIADPNNGVYAAGDGFFPELELADGQQPSSVSWTYDGNGLSGNGEVTLTAGKHTIVAVLTFANGTVETLELVIEAK